MLMYFSVPDNCSSKSADPDEMQHYAFHLGLHFLQKFLEYKGLNRWIRKRSRFYAENMSRDM